MNTFYSETTVRWSDLDANMHLANASYMNYTSFARIEYLRQNGVTLADFAKLKFGPAVLREEISFFREAHEGQRIMISVVISGNSQNGEIFEFEHNLYDKDTGTHIAYSRVFGVWFSTAERKMAPPPAIVQEKIKSVLDPDKCRMLSFKDIAALPVKQQNINPEIFQ